MSGRPTFTIVVSRPTMNRLMQQTASIRPRRPRPAAGRDAGAAGWGPGGAGWGSGAAGWGPGGAGWGSGGTGWDPARARRGLGAAGWRGRGRAPVARPG